jgi:hypothetical protein
MEILAFVKQEQIDPIYLDASYLALPDKDADKAYQVLLKALEDTGRVGIAQGTMHQREYTVFLRLRNQGITVHTRYFQNEIREVQGYGEKPKNLQIKPQEIRLAEQLIETLSDFQPGKVSRHISGAVARFGRVQTRRQGVHRAACTSAGSGHRHHGCLEKEFRRNGAHRQTVARCRRTRGGEKCQEPGQLIGGIHVLQMCFGRRVGRASSFDLGRNICQRIVILLFD